MRQTISGMVAAVAVMTVVAVPAMACGGGLFQGSCSPCGAYVAPCAQAYVAPVYSGCNTGCGGWAVERLPDPEAQYHSAHYPVHQYYYVNQGPTYSGPGNYAPYPTYQEDGVTGWGGYHHRRHYGYGYHHYRPWYHTGYGYHHGYARHHYGYRGHTLHSYY
jgi:hypothetical protein